MSLTKRWIEDQIYDLRDMGYSIKEISEISGIDIEIVIAYLGELED